MEFKRANMQKSITDAEQKQLKRFIRLVFDMEQSRFIQRAKTQNHNIRADRISDDEFEMTVPDYDWEDFRSFLTAFRQIALSKKDSTYLLKIRNIVARYADDSLRVELGKFKSHLSPILEGKYVGIRLGAEIQGEEVSLTSYELLDAVVNSVVFHPREDKERESQLILRAKPWEYIGILLSEIIWPVFKASVWLVNIIRSKNYLPESEFPVK
jgi:hypothetical protein